MEIRSALSVNAVLVNPEPKRHVGIEQQVHDSPAANVGVLILVAVLECNVGNAVERVNLQIRDCIRGTRSDVESRHVVNVKCKECYVLVE